MRRVNSAFCSELANSTLTLQQCFNSCQDNYDRYWVIFTKRTKQALITASPIDDSLRYCLWSHSNDCNDYLS